MLTLQQIKADPARTVARLAVKGFDGKEAIDRVIALDEERRRLQLENDNRAAELNRYAAQIGTLMKQGRKDEAQQAKDAVAQMKAEQKKAAEALEAAEKAQREILLTIPNLPCDAVPEGLTAADNVVEKTGGTMPDLPDDAMPH